MGMERAPRNIVLGDPLPSLMPLACGCLLIGHCGPGKEHVCAVWITLSPFGCQVKGSQRVDVKTFSAGSGCIEDPL